MGTSLEQRQRMLILDMEKIFRNFCEGVRLLNTGDTGSDMLVNYVKECNSSLAGLIDTALRNFCIVKHIPVVVTTENDYGKKTKACLIIDDTDVGDKLEAHCIDFCKAIALYNFTQTDHNERLLTNVALDVFCEERQDMNKAKHLSVLTNLQNVRRRYNNLTYVIRATLSDKQYNIPGLPKEDFSNFDFQHFQAWMSEFDASQRRYVLIAKAMQDIPEEQMDALFRIPWCTIIDFDGTSVFGGLKDYADGHHQMQELSYSQLGPNFTFMLSGKTLYINLHDGDFNHGITASGKHIRNERDIFEPVYNALYSSTFPNLSIVVAGLQNKRIDDFLTDLSDKFNQTDIVYLCNQSGASMQKTDLSPDQGRVFEAPCELYNTLKILHESIEFLPKPQTQSDSLKDGYRFIHSDGTINILPCESAEILKNDFEFLHLDAGKDVTKRNLDEFMHGHVAEWATIPDVKPVINLDSFEKVIELKDNRCYFLLHRPGYGGTTHARIIAWHMHEKMPVLILKRYTEKNEFQLKLDIVYTTLGSKFLLLVDENRFSPIFMDEITNVIRSKLYGIKALLVKRITTAEAGILLRENDPTKKVINLPGNFDTLCRQCFDILKARGQQSKFEERKARLENQLSNPIDRCPLLVNLYLLEENFSLENYINRSLPNDSPTDVDVQKLRNLLAMISICDYYGGISFPFAYISKYLRLTNKTDKAVRNSFATLNELLLESNSGYITKHFKIAEEILRQLLTRNDGFDWHGNLNEPVNEIVDLICDISQNGMDETVNDMVATLFTDKSRSRAAISDPVYTELLDAIGGPNNLRAIGYLANKMDSWIKDNVALGCGLMEYRALAHIYAQYARLRADIGDLDDTPQMQVIVVKEYCDKIQSIIESEGLEDDTLEHMIGMCLIESACLIFDNKVCISEGETSLRTSLNFLSSAIDHFKKSAKYGSPDYAIPQILKAAKLAITFTRESDPILTNSNFDKLRGKPELDKFLLAGSEASCDIELIRDMNLRNTARFIDLAYRNEEEFNKACFANESESALEKLNNYLTLIFADDYRGQYITRLSIVRLYQRKNDLNTKSKSDLEKIYGHLNTLLSMREQHPAEAYVYRLWFEYAKLLDKPLRTALDTARIWKVLEDSRNGDVRLAKYYIFVITLLLHTVGSASDIDVRQARGNLSASLSRYGTDKSSVLDWYANGSGMGKLISRRYCDFEQVVNDNSVVVVTGKVQVSGDSKEGYLSILTPKGLGDWSTNKQSQAFCPPLILSLVSSLDLVKYKLGFSMERIAVSENSLRTLNIKKAVPTDERVRQKTDSTNMFIATNVYRKNNNILLIFGKLSDGTSAAIHRSAVVNGRDATDIEMKKLFTYARKKAIPVRTEQRNDKIQAILKNTELDIPALLNTITPEMLI